MKMNDGAEPRPMKIDNWSGEPDEVSTSGITNRHHSEGCDEEESDDAQGTVVEELHPKVADLHVGSLTGIHHDALPTLAEAEEQQSQTYKGVDAHRCEPGCRILWKSLGDHRS